MVLDFRGGFADNPLVTETRTKEIEMTLNEFVIECSKRTIDPTIALENESILAALRSGDDALVVSALDSEF